MKTSNIAMIFLDNFMDTQKGWQTLNNSIF